MPREIGTAPIRLVQAESLSHEWRCSTSGECVDYSKLTIATHPPPGMDPFIAKLPDPIGFEPIVIPKALAGTEEDVEYTDCVETDMLRMMHLAFLDLKDPTRMDLDRLGSFTADAELLDFFRRHPRIQSNDYYENTGEGQEERNEWGILVLGKPFIYARMGRIELDSNVNNLFRLVRYYFPTSGIHAEIPSFPPNKDLFQQLLDQVCRFLSREGMVISMNITDYEIHEHDNSHMYRFMITIIQINGVPVYRWILNEVWEDDESVDGHSEMSDLRPLCEHNSTL